MLMIMVHTCQPSVAHTCQIIGKNPLDVHKQVLCIGSDVTDYNNACAIIMSLTTGLTHSRVDNYVLSTEGRVDPVLSRA